MPAELERICLKMLAGLASDRYASASEVAEDLRAGGSLRPRSSPGPPRPDAQGLAELRRPRGRRLPQLLPGPRDRDGLPESVAWWKRRIEADPPEGFAVGLLLGPSGSGKSSLLRAGILPRLEARCLVVDVEAASGRGRTEARLLAAVRAADPRLPQGSPLRETLASVRRGSDLAVGTKLVIVLDPFEPWLATEPDARGNDLAEALRQCDGRRLAALLLVRDDFTLQAARFLEQVEVPLVQGRELRHRRAVRARPRPDGPALVRPGAEKLPAEPEPLDPAQIEFLDRSTALLAEQGRVNPARLSLFAQLVADRPWRPESLKGLGGPEALGLAFLDAAFVAVAAHPVLGRRANAVKAILDALLPAPGVAIKGRPARAGSWPPWRDSRRIRPRPPRSSALDGDLRLITPASDEAEERPGVHYQLTHDYLVAPLRRWLNRDRMSTFRGRLGVRLSELAADWAARPSPGNLPGWWELPLLELGTDRGLRTEPERRMLPRPADATVPGWRRPWPARGSWPCSP